MKKKIAVLLLLVGCILEAKSFRSSSSGRSSSFRSSSSSFKSSSSSGFKSRSSSSSSFKSSSSGIKTSSKPVIKSVRPSTTTTTTKSRVNTTTNTTKKTTVNNNNTTIINNNSNTNRGGGLDVMDVILLNSVMNSSRPRETVVVEKPVVITDKDEVKQEIHKTVVVEKQKEGMSGLAMFGIIILALFIMMAVIL